jgi:hypothetical protein
LVFGRRFLALDVRLDGVGFAGELVNKDAPLGGPAVGEAGVDVEGGGVFLVLEAVGELRPGLR